MSVYAAELMRSEGLSHGGNRILAQIANDDVEHLITHGSRRSFARHDVLIRARETTASAYFIEHGVASTVKPEAGGRRTEVCLNGPEGFVNAAVVQGDGYCRYETFVQSDRLVAFEVNADAVRHLFETSSTFRRIMLHAFHVQLTQISENLVSAAWQPIPARLARWLLMYQDRMDTPLLEVTHEFMAMMIGAERARVTVALHDLEDMGAVSAIRGRVVVKNRAALEKLADGTYGAAEEEARRLREAGVAADPIA